MRMQDQRQEFNELRIAVLRLHCKRVGEPGGPMNEQEKSLYELIAVVESLIDFAALRQKIKNLRLSDRVDVLLGSQPSGSSPTSHDKLFPIVESLIAVVGRQKLDELIAVAKSLIDVRPQMVDELIDVAKSPAGLQTVDKDKLIAVLGILIDDAEQQVDNL